MITELPDFWITQIVPDRPTTQTLLNMFEKFGAKEGSVVGARWGSKILIEHDHVPLSMATKFIQVNFIPNKLFLDFEVKSNKRAEQFGTKEKVRETYILPFTQDELMNLKNKHGSLFFRFSHSMSSGGEIKFLKSTGELLSITIAMPTTDFLFAMGLMGSVVYSIDLLYYYLFKFCKDENGWYKVDVAKQYSQTEAFKEFLFKNT